jgi:hypothetical protein
MAPKAISNPFASCRKEFDYRMQYSLIFSDFLGFAWVCRWFRFAQLAKGKKFRP